MPAGIALPVTGDVTGNGGVPVRTDARPYRLPAVGPASHFTGLRPSVRLSHLRPRASRVSALPRRDYPSGSSQCSRPMLMIRIRIRAAWIRRSRAAGSSGGTSRKAAAVITMWST